MTETLSEIMRRAKDAYNSMTPERRAELLRQQCESVARSEARNGPRIFAKASASEIED